MAFCGFRRADGSTRNPCSGAVSRVSGGFESRPQRSTRKSLFSGPIDHRGDNGPTPLAPIAPPSAGANLARRIELSSVAPSVDLSPVDMRDHSSELPELWDIDRLVAYLGTSKHLVYRLTHEHRIRFLRVGKELRFRPEDVAAWLESQAVDAAPAASSKVRRGRPRSRDRAA
jgi:excisionase family DNA binding protein